MTEQRATTSAFLDTNVVLYLLSGDPARADRAEALLAQGGVVSVQVLNEFVSVAVRKLRLPWPDIREVLAAVRANCTVVPVTAEVHERALDLIEQHSLSVYDALIVAAALDAGCTTLWTEDMQDGRRFDDHLTLRNPFRESH
ncbi:MAG: PIN domain-containing protein [Sphaerotilus natans subsp. sulfidivorans]|uniref:PIN domain-containing protein n=1 Tax=Sphaerotilus sulfidivorans TaxID=639200 RepID=UPI002356F42B|nr:PIN domain-containing protein [Sphaerotilus sulfidivorans]MCK6401729.1 PIN domain-containing protein [Sphaerotilus sulfidivorans]